MVFQGGLLLTATAVFLTTSPPISSPTPIIAYTLFGPYVCLLLSFATALGGVIVSSGLRFVIGNCKKEWFYKVHIYFCLSSIPQLI
jgi:uncharacterized membrane protein YraQ (UPF0718 family)